MTAQEMWNLYLQDHPECGNEPHEAWCFGSGEDMANQLAALVVTGKKTATASAFDLYRIDNEPLPPKGGFNIILDSSGNAVCIIKTMNVYTAPFCSVTKEHAFKEGEGDRSLEYWREVHRRFFSKELEECNLTFDENKLVVCEEFEVVFK